MNARGPRAAACVLALGLTGCGSGDRTAAVLHEARGRPAPVFVFVVDSLRADRTSLHGAERDTTPFLRALAEQSLVFERALAAGGDCAAGYAALVGSGARARADDPSPRRAWLPTAAREQGYVAHALLAPPALAPFADEAAGWSSSKAIPPRPLRPYADAGDLRPHLQHELLRLPPPPFLLYVHLADPDIPWQRHAEHEFDPGYDGTFDGSPAALQPFLARAPSPANRARALDLYDGEVAAVDAWLAAAAKRLQQLGLFEPSWLIVTADHGLELWEPETLGHEGLSGEGVRHVPLLVKPPGGLPAARRIDEEFPLADLLPTLLDALGLAAPADLAGRSWLPWLLQAAPAPPAAR